MTATPILKAAAVVANHTCLRHQPSFLSSRRRRRISRANAFLRGLNALGSRLLCSSIHQPRAAVRDLDRKGRPLRRSLQFPLVMGNGSDRPAVVTTKCVQLFRDELDEVRSQQERSACRRCGMLQGRYLRCAYDFLPPRLGGEGDGRPLLLYEAEIEPCRLVMATRSIAVCASG